MRKRILKWSLIVAALVAVLMIRQGTSIVHMNETAQDYGLWSILPALVTLILCFATKEVIPSLFAGIVLGGIISGKFIIVQEFLIPSMIRLSQPCSGAQSESVKAVIGAAASDNPRLRAAYEPCLASRSSFIEG